MYKNFVKNVSYIIKKNSRKIGFTYSTVDRIIVGGKRVFFPGEKQICVVLLESVPMAEESKVLMINILFEVRSFIHR